MKGLYIIGVVIQLIGYTIVGIILLKVLLQISGSSMMWWEWIILLVLAPCARYLLREGLNLCILANNQQSPGD